MGRVGDAFTDALRPQLGGRSVGTYAVNYPASYDFLTAQDGAADATNHIAAMASQCPSTRIVLGGYSQGAAVVDMLAGIPPLGNKIGEVGSAPPLPANLDNNVVAVAVFGNPSTKFSIPITNSVFGGRAIDLCKDGDPICSRGRNPFAHSDYVTAGMTDQAASYVARLLSANCALSCSVASDLVRRTALAVATACTAVLIPIATTVAAPDGIGRQLPRHRGGLRPWHLRGTGPRTARRSVRRLAAFQGGRPLGRKLCGELPRRLRLPRGRQRSQRRQRARPVHDGRLPQHASGAWRLLAGRGGDGRDRRGAVPGDRVQQPAAARTRPTSSRPSPSSATRRPSSACR